MKRIALILLYASLFILITACNAAPGDLRGATPVGYAQPILNLLTDETAESVSISDLLETPDMYEGQHIEVSGIYYQRQVVICSTRPQRSPAQWSLSDGQERIPVGGINDHLENLPSGRIEITVVGRWLRWQGPVGCGRQAQVTEVWYLDVLKVISPNPISIAALGPTRDPDTITLEPPGQPPDESGAYPAPEETSESDPTSLTTTPVLSGTAPAGLPGPVGTPVLLPTPSATTAVQNNPTATPTLAIQTTATATSANTNGVTPTATSAGGTPSATATTNPNASPNPTSTGGNGAITVDQEDLPSGSIESALLGDNEIHRWPFVITSTAVITVNIASEIALDANIAIRSPSGDIIAEQNKAQDGAPEILAAVPLTELGTYDILISSENDVSGYYAILVLDQDSYTFVFNGTLTVGQSQSTNMRENNDHFWQFYGTAGDTVTIRVTPSDDADLFIRLFGPNDTLLVDFHDETGGGEIEEIISFTLPDTGIYSILVGEFSFGEAAYSIALTGG